MIPVSTHVFSLPLLLKCILKNKNPSLSNPQDRNAFFLPITCSPPEKLP
jgi:hypothetical protein